MCYGLSIFSILLCLFASSVSFDVMLCYMLEICWVFFNLYPQVNNFSASNIESKMSLLPVLWVFVSKMDKLCIGSSPAPRSLRAHYEKLMMYSICCVDC